MARYITTIRPRMSTNVFWEVLYLLAQFFVFQWQERWYSAYILMAPLAVDSFLFISGALLSYGFVKTMSKPKARFNIILYYVHRYIR